MNPCRLVVVELRTIDYLKKEGYRATVKKVRDRLFAAFGGAGSKTVFLMLADPIAYQKIAPAPNAFTIRRLDVGDSASFKRINFYPHIDTNAYLSSSLQGAVGAFADEEMCAYVCFEQNNPKHIYGTGDFLLDSGDAWIGPCYVKKDYRGLGLNSFMVRFAIEELSRQGVKRFFTSVNASNTSSLNSFAKSGFKTIGVYSKEYGLEPIDSSANLAERLRV